MRTYRWTSLLLVAALFAAAACLLPTVSITDPNSQATILAATVNAAVGQTQVAAGTPPTATLSPTVTDTPSLTFTPTQTPTASNTPPPTLTFTPFVFFTVTPLVPMISVSVNTNCREGPGKVYDISGSLLVGQTVQVFGRDPTGVWWQIKDPSGGEYCWVSDLYGTLTGLTDTVPIYTPWPTPLPTYTATPAPGFDLSYSGLVSCTTEWWPEITLDNTGDTTFRSVEITVRDMVTSHEVSDDLNSFVDNYDCSNSKSRSTLLPDKSVTISSPSFTDDPTGHRLRTTITLCSERDLDGDCITETITAKP
jgi:uncharacterized protein YgiM (DUF1202 family)